MNPREKEFLYWLCSLRFLGAAAIRALQRHFGSFERIYYMERTELLSSAVLRPRQAELVVSGRARFPACLEEYRRLCGQGVRCIAFAEAEYPERLRELADGPAMLFVKGSLPDDAVPSVAVVGARGCSAYGEQITEEFARALAAEGVQVVSGLAAGIDSAAHRGALRTPGGRTFGVLGCGINICYPRENYSLSLAMQEGGGVISEFPADVNPLPANFPLRNRIISGLSDAVLVTEAREKSGSLITAELGLDQGREIFAVPGRVTDCFSEGCNRLIAQGAHPALSPEDILETLGIKFEKRLKIREKNLKSLAKEEKMVYSVLDFKARHLDEIVEASGLSAAVCMELLLELELKGWVFHTSGQYYGKKP